MPKIVLLLLLLVQAPDRGTLKINRVRTDDAPSDYYYALTTYTNTTQRTFSAVTITCDAYNTVGEKVASNERSFFERITGPIAPGFVGTKEVPVDMRGAGRFGHMECAITSAR